MSVTTVGTSAIAGYTGPVDGYRYIHRSHILLQGGFFSRLRRVFRRKPKRGSGREKRGKKEVQRNKKCINDPEPTEVVTEVIEKKDTDLHLTAELEGETSAQEMSECNETVTRL